MAPLEINGTIPELSGKQLSRLLCEEYWHAGSLVEPANVIHIQAENIWHRLYFDCGIIFWRTGKKEPTPYSMGELNGDVQIADLGAKLNLNCETFKACRASEIVGGSKVSFEFESGRKLVFQNINDSTNYTG